MASAHHPDHPALAGGAHPFPHSHLLAISALKPWEMLYLLGEAEKWVDYNRASARTDHRLAGLTQINAFFEPSTRTALSFEIAGKRLGADVVSLGVAGSSVKKGETLLDTALTLGAMRPDVIVIRHGSSGAVQLIAEKLDCPVLNAGDGRHEHPTQALLDALTIRRRKGRIEGLTVAICGDILHSRVARSNFQLLASLGAKVRAVAPPTLMPPFIESLGADPYTDMAAGLEGVDVVMMLRLQTERMAGAFLPSTREYYRFFGLTEARLARAAPDVLVMHPGPMNRGVEIESAIADDIVRSAVTEQVEMGVAVRMACLDVLTRGRRGIEGWTGGAA
ncbi:aspartate carbamoyltransferase catalytic subunit [Polymorphobacter multimanifer]|uniref:Aspartate carbamoyltransferase n=1 Tax=Polymorphobacter multimanifer TaxID=1070431 RepID=A0A841L4C9_9SPHN|nr:aspartate carbamoyltransferase catalytic subunit [Polymorphobacter multimanifer]MBB6227517.1 aspartate carbamoyltransferase catalytic subunit [Polymorphobacter multimanifer]